MKLDPNNYNNKHPELQDGEMFIMNISDKENIRTDYQLDYFYSSSRTGVQAYDSKGNKIFGHKPVFGVHR